MERCGMTSGPPAAIESVVSLFVPPLAREHVLGDLAERYSSRRQYGLEAVRTWRLKAPTDLQRGVWRRRRKSWLLQWRDELELNPAFEIDHRFGDLAQVTAVADDVGGDGEARGRRGPVLRHGHLHRSRRARSGRDLELHARPARSATPTAPPAPPRSSSRAACSSAR